MERKSIGQFIAALRKVNGLTQKELADKLNVSDKAVSRWERDETAPDISLIPVIADIFGVTCDELLCGERKINNENSSVSDEGLSAKGEKQRRRILAVGISQYKNRSIISIGLALIGLIAAAICNIQFTRGYLGFFIALILYLAAIIFQSVIFNKTLLSVADDEFSDGEVGKFRKKAFATAEFVIGFIITLTAFNVPLLIGPWDAYSGVIAGDWVKLGLMYAAVVAFLCVIISSVLNSLLSGKGIWEDTQKDKRKRNNVFLAGGCVIGLAAAMALTVLAYNLVTHGGSALWFAPSREFADFESFAEFMERDVPSTWGEDYPEHQIGFIIRDDNIFDFEYYDNVSNAIEIIGDEEAADDMHNDDPFYEFFGENGYGFADNGDRIIIKDAGGNILLDCEHNNKTVLYTYCGDEVDGWLPIKVTTEYDIPEGRMILQNIRNVFYAVTVVEAGLALFVFFFVIHIKKKNNLY